MGLSSFLRQSSEPKASAFDAIPDEVRQAIANDLCAMIECVKAWRAAVQSPEHATAMVDEAKKLARSLGGKAITMAMTGNSDFLDDPDWWKALNLPAAITDIIEKVKTQMQPEDTANGTGP